MVSARPSLVKATTLVISSPAEVVSGILLQYHLQRILYSKQGAFKDGLLPKKWCGALQKIRFYLDNMHRKSKFRPLIISYA